jgi:hypothetical protein
MRIEAETIQSERYLFADTYFSDAAVAVWQEECIKRCNGQPKDAAYEKYVYWKRQENEIAVFTSYAYADFPIPAAFDIIFEIGNPVNHIQVVYELTQALYEGWLPATSINKGHKHLCVFTFPDTVPEILNLLHREDEKFSTVPKGQRKLGFCHSKDFAVIRASELH